MSSLEGELPYLIAWPVTLVKSWFEWLKPWSWASTNLPKKTYYIVISKSYMTNYFTLKYKIVFSLHYCNSWNSKTPDCPFRRARKILKNSKESARKVFKSKYFIIKSTIVYWIVCFSPRLVYEYMKLFHCPWSVKL